MSGVNVLLAHTSDEAGLHLDKKFGLPVDLIVTDEADLRGVVVGDIYMTDEFADDDSRAALELGDAARLRKLQPPPPRPAICRMVHYHSYGTPGGEYLPEPRAAVITEVHGDPADGLVSLAVINPTGIHFNQGKNNGGIPFSDEPKPGHWSWPPRA